VTLQERKPKILHSLKILPKGCIMSDKVLGSVMVVGGGIAGMQAALDLANSGYYVHLVEKSPAIGGTMAQIDKTFPTNDCAM
jgi:heterodisulfide reductase subunit A-like polyferredoxin